MSPIFILRDGLRNQYMRKLLGHRNHVDNVKSAKQFQHENDSSLSLPAKQNLTRTNTLFLQIICIGSSIM